MLPPRSISPLTGGSKLDIASLIARYSCVTAKQPRSPVDLIYVWIPAHSTHKHAIRAAFREEGCIHAPSALLLPGSQYEVIECNTDFTNAQDLSTATSTTTAIVINLHSVKPEQVVSMVGGGDS